MTSQTKKEKPSCLSRHVLKVFRKNATVQKDLEDKLGLIDDSYYHNRAAIKDEINLLGTKLRKITTVKEKMEISAIRRRFLAEHGYCMKERHLDLKEFIKSVDDIIYTRKGTPIPLAFKQQRGVENGLRKIDGPFSGPKKVEESNFKKEIPDERKPFQYREIVPPFNGRKIEEVYNDLKAEGRRLIRIRDLDDYIPDESDVITNWNWNGPRNEQENQESTSEDETNEMGNLENQLKNIELEQHDPLNCCLEQINVDMEKKNEITHPQQTDTQKTNNGFLRTNTNCNSSNDSNNKGKDNNNINNNNNNNNQLKCHQQKQVSSQNSPLSWGKATSPSSRTKTVEQESGPVQSKPARQSQGRPMSCPPAQSHRDPSATARGVRYLEGMKEERGKDVERKAGKPTEAWGDGSHEDNSINPRRTERSNDKIRPKSSLASSTEERNLLTTSPPSETKINSTTLSAISAPPMKMLGKKRRKKVTFGIGSELEKEMVYDARPHEAITKGYATLQMTVARKSVSVYVPKFKNEILCKEQLSGRANAKSSFEIEQARIKRRRITIALRDEDS